MNGGMKRRRLAYVIIAVSLVLGAGVAGWRGWARMAGWWRVAEAKVIGPRPDPARYAELRKSIEETRVRLAMRYRASRNPQDKEAVLRDARVALETCMPGLMRCWLGTPWDFNGTAEAPGAGKIACGYFVATVLHDSGFRVERGKLGRQASQNILHTFLPKESCMVTAGEPYDKFAGRKREPGIYVVGLDTHVAFLVVTADGFHFIHSSGSSPWQVVDESRAEAGALARSNYRVIGNLTADRKVLANWLNGEHLQVAGNE